MTAVTAARAAGLLSGGADLGAPIMRKYDRPWVAAQTVRTVASAVRVGSLLYAGTPGEGYPAIRSGVASAVTGASMVIQLGLADDQLGYLIAPASYAPANGMKFIAGEPMKSATNTEAGRS